MNNHNNQNNQSIFDIDFRDVALLLLKRAWIIILVATCCFAYDWFFVEQERIPMYTAQAKMYVTNSNDVKYYYSTSDSFNSSKLIETCNEVIKTNSVMSMVSKELDGEYSAAYIRGAINISSVNETEVMLITCVTAKAEASVEICNAVLKVVPEILKDKIKVGAAEEIDRAEGAVQGNYPQIANSIKFAVLAALGVAVVVVLVYLLDTRIKSKEEITMQYNIPVLSDIPNFNIKNKERYQAYYEHR